MRHVAVATICTPLKWKIIDSQEDIPMRVWMRTEESGPNGKITIYRIDRMRFFCVIAPQYLTVVNGAAVTACCCSDHSNWNILKMMTMIDLPKNINVRHRSHITWAWVCTAHGRSRLRTHIHLIFNDNRQQQPIESIRGEYTFWTCSVFGVAVWCAGKNSIIYFRWWMRVNHHLRHKIFQTSVTKEKILCDSTAHMLKGIRARCAAVGPTAMNRTRHWRTAMPNKSFILSVAVFVSESVCFFSSFDETRISFACTFSVAPISSFQDRLAHPYTNAMEITSEIFDFRI